MEFTELELPGVWLIAPEIQADERGVFRRHFCTEEFAVHGINPRVAQGNVSENPRLHTLRGFHYQIAPAEEAKTISCLSGAVYDIIVDLRPDSPTFLKWTAAAFSARDRLSLHVPAGCANAWLTVEADTVLHYYMSESYRPQTARGFRYDDPMFGFRWPAPPQVISARDVGYPDFDPETIG